MKYKFISNSILTIFLFSILSTYSQNVISGKVLDSLNNPIEFANIILIESGEGSIKSGAVSSENGDFSLVVDKNGKFKISIRFIGYESYEKDITISTSINLGNIILAESTGQLDEVVITSTKDFITKKEDKIVLNIQNSPLKVGYDGIEVLERSPYLWVDSNGSILIKNESATVLINGRKSNLSGSDLSNYLASINSENIKSIEITTNKGADMDGESTGGIINIVLLKKPLGFNSTLKTYYFHKAKGYYRSFIGGVFNYGAKSWNIYGFYNYSENVSKSRLNSDIFYNDTENLINTKRFSEANSPRHNYQLGNVSEIWPNHEFGIEFFGTFSRPFSNVQGDLDITNNNDVLDRGTISVTNNINYHLFNGVFNYKWKINKNNETLNLFVDYTNHEDEDSNVNLSTYELGTFNDNVETNDSNTETQVFSFQSDYNKKFDKGLKFQTGVKYSNTNRFNDLESKFLENDVFVIDEDRTTAFEYDEVISAGYFSLSKSFLSKHFLKVGLRLENTDINRIDLLDDNSRIAQNYTDFFPSAYYSYDFSKRNSLSASYSRSIRRPSFNSLNNNIVKVNDFRFIIGNPDLEPQIVNKYEINYRFKKQGITFYYNKTTNAINGVYTLDGDVAFYQKKNAGSQVQYGLLYNRANNINDWMYLRLSGNFFFRKFVNEQGEDSFEKHSLFLNLFSNFKLTKTLQLDVSSRLNTAVTDAFYEEEGKHRINLILKKSFFDKKLNARIYINDIFNSLEYNNVRVFDNYVTSLSTKPQTREFGLWLTYNFSNNIKASSRKNKSKNSVKNRL